jgi:hypothetical protein
MSTASFRLPVRPPLAGLQGAARELERRGWCVRWDVGECCGVPDVRLVVDGGEVSVEVLVPDPDDHGWDAVRVKPASRQVWRGPQHDCPADQLVWFVEDLLTRDVEHLPGRYRLLG